MKWIEIEKAKPKFKQDYLIIEKITGAAVVAHLSQTMQTANGLKHAFTWDDQNTYEATHIALITLPSAEKKEVPNE